MQARIGNLSYKGVNLKGAYPVGGTSDTHVTIKHPKLGSLKLPRDRVEIVGGAPFSEPVALSFDKIIENIRMRFAVLERKADDVINGTVRALTVSGKPGIGKTFTLQMKLEAAAAEGTINYTEIKGVMSPVGLYMELYKNRKANEVILIDDTDSVFNDEDALSILKAALDTGKRRRVTYNKVSSVLMNEGVPNAFSYEGTVVFITNVDLQAVAEGNSKLAPHIDAIVSRSLFVDLGVHSKQAVMARITDVCQTTDMLTSKGLTDTQVTEALNWVMANADTVRSLSLRTVLMVADEMKSSPRDWREMCEVTLLRRK